MVHKMSTLVALPIVWVKVAGRCPLAQRVWSTLMSSAGHCWLINENDGYIINYVFFISPTQQSQ